MESLFFVAAHKNVVANVVGNGDMQNPAKYRTKIGTFAFSKEFPCNPSKLIRGSSHL
jgi:hypothetical protein